MATSLAYFRSDYTIVHIPHGNFLLAKVQLYANINLLRLGCGGRSALSLEEPRYICYLNSLQISLIIDVRHQAIQPKTVSSALTTSLK